MAETPRLWTSVVDQDLALHLGDRHLALPSVGFQAAVGGRAVVRIVCGRRLAACYAGQHLLWMLTCLLARQFAVVHEIQLDLPKGVPLLPGVALFGAGADLLETLEQTVDLIAGMAVRPNGPKGRPTLFISVGAGRGDGVGVLGDGWNAFVGDPGEVPALIPASSNSLGPHFAACLGAGEAFKRLRGLRPDAGEFPRQLGVSLWDLRTGPWATLGVGPRLPLELDPFYVIGGGAVAQALFSATASSGVRTHATAIDDDRLDGSNLNRCSLSTMADIGKPKVEIIRDALSQTNVNVCPAQVRWPAYALDRLSGQRADLRELEDAFQYSLILSCVDKNDARHAIQRYYPRVLWGGSTHELRLTIANYAMGSPYECLRCSNPLPAVPEVEVVAARLRQLAPAARSEECARRGVDPNLVDEYLRRPECGTLGEEEIRKFRDAGPKDWSVGFVSVAAGTLLAAKLLQRGLGQDPFQTQNGHSYSFNFRYPGGRWYMRPRRAECECSGHGLEMYRALWGPDRGQATA